MSRGSAKRVICLLLALPLTIIGVRASQAEYPQRAQSSSSAPSTSAQAAVRYGWGSVVAGDEFSYRGRPSSRKWQLYDSVGHAGHGRRAPSAWTVDGSVATVRGDPSGTTGGMSARFGSQRYGRWETRMRVPVRDSEYHPVLLLWPDEPATSRCAEVDYAESSRVLTSVRFFLHYGCAPDQTRASQRIDTAQWHNYAVEWTRHSVTGYIDGVRYFHDTVPEHIPRMSMHQTVQLDWFPDGTATERSAMMIDWVRVYREG